jgi:MSHA biogenesis protein MshO
MKSRGFSLVELVIVIVITGIIAAMGLVFFRPAMDSYMDIARRATLTDVADTALRRMGREIRSAVPNSIRWPNNQCIEIMPSSTGGRYRMATDTVNAGSAPLDISQPVTAFDVLTPLWDTASPPGVLPAKVGDWVVIGNQNTNDVYTGVTRSDITAITSPASLVAQHKITVTSHQYPSGYNGGRFMVVENNGGSPAVVYVCSGADGTVNASGNGKGTLYRVPRAFNSTYPVSCPATTGGSVLATNVRTCNIIYNASHAGSQQSGFVWMQLDIAQSNEIISTAYGVHVDNVP